MDPGIPGCMLSRVIVSSESENRVTDEAARVVMKFGLIDRIVELTRGEQIVAVKAVSLAEEYLADHFPTFPVLPGVFMLEAMAEAAAWLVRDASDFAPTLVLLREARNVTYKSFVRPGSVLRVEVNCRRLESADSDFDGVGFCEDVEVVRGRFGLRHATLESRGAGLTSTDQLIKKALRERFGMLQGAVASDIQR